MAQSTRAPALHADALSCMALRALLGIALVTSKTAGPEQLHIAEPTYPILGLQGWESISRSVSGPPKYCRGDLQTPKLILPAALEGQIISQ